MFIPYDNSAGSIQRGHEKWLSIVILNNCGNNWQGIGFRFEVDVRSMKTVSSAKVQSVVLLFQMPAKTLRHS